jgi:hypothetical protein
MKYYIARNTLAVTGPMTKKAALEVWTHLGPFHTDPADGKYQLCKETGNMATFTPVMDLN